MRRFSVFALLAVACGGGPLDPPEVRDLERARERWETRQPTEYTFEGRIVCFCDPATAVWTEIRVRNDTVVATTPIGMLPGGLQPAGPGAWRTVPELFHVIETSAKSQFTRDVVAVYDEQLGYPRSIDVRCHANILDCGTSYEARNLRVIR